MSLPRTLLAIVSLLNAGYCFAADAFFGIETKRIERVINLANNFDPTAASEINSLATDFPTSPIPDILRLSRLYWNQVFVAYDETLSDVFEESATAALHRLKALERGDRESAQSKFAIASIEGLLTIYYSDKGDKWASIWKSRSVIKSFKSILEDDPDFHDAKLILGITTCYLSKERSTLSKLALPIDASENLEKGLGYMNDAKTLGLFTKVDASFYLAKIHRDLMDDENRAKAELQTLVGMYPNNLYFRTELAISQSRLNEHDESRDNALRVLADPHVQDFPGIETQALNSLMWSAYETQIYDITIRSAMRLEELAKTYPTLSYTASWAKHARAEALQSQGHVEQAVRLWQSIPATHREPYDRAQSREQTVRAQ